MPLSFSGRGAAATAVVAGKPERWVKSAKRGGDSVSDVSRGIPPLPMCEAMHQRGEGGEVESKGEAAAAGLGCPASLAELQLLTELLALLEPLSPLVQRPFLSSLGAAPVPNFSYLTPSDSKSESSGADHLKYSARAFNSRAEPGCRQKSQRRLSGK